MATVTHNLTTYSSVTFTYTVVHTDTRTTVTITNVAFKNTRSGGTTQALTLAASSATYNTTLNKAIAKGTKTKSFAVSWSKWYDRGHTDVAQTIDLYSTIWSADGDTWEKETPNLTVSVPKKASYAVTFDANGGSGAPGQQTKWYGESLSLSSTRPTRADFSFLGWATSAAATSAAYQPGGTYAGNAALKLYAVWQRTYSAPVANISKVYRCDSAGNATDSGKYVAAEVSYTVFDSSWERTWKLSVAPSDGSSAAVTSSSPKSDSDGLAKLVAGGAISGDKQYAVTVELYDSQGGSSRKATASAHLSSQYYPIDVLRDGGHGVAIGGACETDGFHVFMDMFVSRWAGIIQMFGGSTPPSGWLLCDGSAVSRTQYSALFEAIGTTWGAGDGSTTFNLPDLRGRAPIGAGTGSGLSARALGDKGGSQNAVVPYHTHTIAHTHNLTSSKQQAWVAKAGTGATEPGGGISSSGKYYAAANATGYAWIDVTAGSNSANAGYAGSSGNATGANMQPFSVVNFIIYTGAKA